MSISETASILGLFEKRIQGDDALLELARFRFRQTEMGIEVHADTIDHLRYLLKFRPSDLAHVVVHLPREFDLLSPTDCHHIAELASLSAGQVHGFVMHDHRHLPRRMHDYVRAAQALNDRLSRVTNSPTLFIEYAAGIEPGIFLEFFQRILGLSRVSACIDVGHVGIRQTRRAYEVLHPNVDVCALKTQASWNSRQLLEVESAMNTALNDVLDLIRDLGALEKTVHFHLHDGHPLSSASPYGVSDHLSFLAQISIDRGRGIRQLLPPMYGVQGLNAIIAAALRSLGANRVSFTLEIHPTFEREALKDASPLFVHWRDKTHAEQMNHWLSVLIQNSQAVRVACAEVLQLRRTTST